MSTYRNDNPQELTAAIESVIGQTRPPDEVFVVVDGPVPK
jgi:glycosyltransferase involved in cell wall biosynthesis